MFLLSSMRIRLLDLRDGLLRDISWAVSKILVFFQKLESAFVVALAFFVSLAELDGIGKVKRFLLS